MVLTTHLLSSSITDLSAILLIDASLIIQASSRISAGTCKSTLA